MRNKLAIKLVIFLMVLSVLIVGGCAGNGPLEEAVPAEEGDDLTEIGPDEEEAGIETEPEDETGEETVAETEPEDETGEDTGIETPADVIEVEIRDFKYLPAELTVSVGQTVRWTNFDTAIHNVRGSGLNSENLEKGESFTFTFEEPGTYDYICSIHPWMEGTVIATS